MMTEEEWEKFYRARIDSESYKNRNYTEEIRL